MNNKSPFAHLEFVSPDDLVFLQDIFKRFPRVEQGYASFINTDPFKRVPLASKTLENQPRTGWEIRFDLPDIFRPILITHSGEYYGDRILAIEKSASSKESVLEHSAEAAELYPLIHYNDTYIEKQWGNEILKFHDFHEAIDGDFTPSCKIDKAEKKRLEDLSFNLLCESRHSNDALAAHIYVCHEIFEGKLTDFKQSKKDMLNILAKNNQSNRFVEFATNLYTMTPDTFDVQHMSTKTNETDALHMGKRIIRMKSEKHVPVNTYDRFEPFWPYIEKKLVTPEAKAFYGLLRTLDQ